MDWHFDDVPTPDNDFDHVAFEVIRVISSIEFLNKKYGRLEFAVKLAKQALSEIEDAEIEHKETIN